MTNTTPRIAPLPTDEWTEEADKALMVLTAHGPDGQAAPELTPETRPKSNILGIYAHHPDLMAGWLPYSNHLRNSTLSDRQREIAIIRTTWLGYGEYEWAQHVRMSEAAGWLSAEETAALQVGAESSVWSDEDAVLLRAIDEMCVAKNVTDETWAELAEQFDRKQLIDLLFTVGTYDFHCMAFRAMGLQLDEGLVPFPAEHRLEVSP